MYTDEHTPSTQLATATQGDGDLNDRRIVNSEKYLNLAQQRGLG